MADESIPITKDIRSAIIICRLSNLAFDLIQTLETNGQCQTAAEFRARLTTVFDPMPDRADPC